MVIPRETRRITYSTEIRNLKKRLSLSAFQGEVLVGCLLGDAHLENNWSKTNYRLKISQSKQQEKYVDWKYKIFKDWVLTEPKLHVSTNSMRFTTVNHSDFNDFHHIFYEGRKKIVPVNLGQLLSPLALAVWFMDDGNRVAYGSKIAGYHINSQSFTREENEFITQTLKEKFGLCTSLQANNGRVRIFVRAQSRQLFVNLIESYIIPSMRYKLS